MAKVSGPMRAAKTKGEKAKPRGGKTAARASTREPKANSSRAPKPAIMGAVRAVGQPPNKAPPMASKQPKRAAPPKAAPVRKTKASKTVASPKAPQSAAPAYDLSDVLAQAAWLEADEALARALRDFAAAERASQKLGARLRGGGFAAEAQSVEDALLAASQSLRQAGRKRGMQRFGEPGAVVAFDPHFHVLTKPGAKAPAMVRIVAQGVQRGVGLETDVVLKALATPLRRRAVQSMKLD